MMIPNYDGQLFVDGLLVEIEAGQSTVVVEVEFEHWTTIVGALIFVSDCKFGDYGKLTVANPDNEDLATFGDNAYLPGGVQQLQVQIPESDGTPVPPLYKYKFTLNAIDTDGRHVIVWLLLRK